MQPTTLRLDNLSNIGGFPVRVTGQPKLIDSPGGPAMEFNGVSDAIFIDANPLAGAAAFTMEAIFRPDAGGTPEQRFVHIQEDGAETRLLLETRVTPAGQWYADTYIRGPAADRALIDPALTHPLGRWHSLAMVYDGSQMIQYVDGSRELAGPLAFAGVGRGRISIGCRINSAFHFKGAIRVVRFTPSAVPPAELLRP